MPTGKHSPANSRPAADTGSSKPIHRERSRRRALDRLGLADGLAKTAMAIVALSLLTLVVDWGRGHSVPNATVISLVRTIGLGHPALVPAGHEAARPWPRPTAVEGRYLPSLPRMDPGLVPLLDTQNHFFDPSVAP